MPPQRDLFASFERMRREMDELFGEYFDPAHPPRRAGFAPRVDVVYAEDPPRAIVLAELAGIDMEQLSLQVEGRTLVLAGRRAAPAAEGKLYQQLEIQHGPFRRAVELGADVDADAAKATYTDGILRVELPLKRPERSARSVPVQRGGDA